MVFDGGAWVMNIVESVDTFFETSSLKKSST